LTQYVFSRQKNLNLKSGRNTCFEGVKNVVALAIVVVGKQK